MAYCWHIVFNRYPQHKKNIEIIMKSIVWYLKRLGGGGGGGKIIFSFSLNGVKVFSIFTYLLENYAFIFYLSVTVKGVVARNAFKHEFSELHVFSCSIG